jgi:hypothetical protein
VCGAPQLQDVVFKTAWLKLLSKRATFANNKPLAINGRECSTAYLLDDTCMARLEANVTATPTCQMCTGK